MKTYKKLFFSAFSLPLAGIYFLDQGLTFQGFLWQRRRKQEKIVEVQERKEKLFQTSVLISNSLPWENSTHEEFDNNWQYTNVELIGQYSGDEVMISKTKDQETGYNLISLFYVKGDSNKEFPVLIDRGWVPKGDEGKVKVNTSRQLKIKGILYSGDKTNKYTYGII